MHKYGGVYIDLDFECLRNMEKAIIGKKIVLGRMGSNIFFSHSIPNAWYGVLST